MTIKRTVAALSLLAVGATVSACGNAGDSSKAGGDDTSAAGSSSSSSKSGTADGHLDKFSLVKAITVGQAKAGSAHMVMTMSGVTSLHGEGDVNYQGSTPEMKMTMTMAQLGGKKIQMRFVKGIFYMSIPQLTPAGKFLKIDPQDKSNPMGKAFGGVTQQMDPLAGFKAMKSSVKSVRFAGQSTVQGVKADHYVVTVDSAALMKSMKVQQKVPNMPSTLTYDMWLDDKNQLREARYDVAGVKSDIQLSKWGEPVHVTAPPASQVVDPSQTQLGGSVTG